MSTLVSSSLAAVLGAAVPSDHCRQSSAAQLLRNRVEHGLRARRLLLYGCAGIEAQSLLQAVLPQAECIAVTLPALSPVAPTSPEKAHAMMGDDGTLPFTDRSFDVVYAPRALECLRFPEAGLGEIARVLSDDGRCIGQTAQFEPCQRPVLWNFKPYGLKRMAADVGLELVEVRPGIDGFTLMQRLYRRRTPPQDDFFENESPVNREIESSGRRRGRSHRTINSNKLLYCGHFAFVLARSRQAAVEFPGSAAYWQRRYAQGGDSGAGSYGAFAEFKAEVLNGLFRELGLCTAIEFGCGDGNQLRLLDITDYLGVDVSEDAIASCQQEFAGQAGRRFLLDRDYAGEGAQCSLSLDVIYHLIEDEVFDNYMRRLFEAADRCVIIYSSNTESQNVEAPHVRHRRFAEWVALHQADWHLWRHVPNRFPFLGDHLTGSFADFFVYRRWQGA